jgi:divalent metal cation (Fe/Co/Zn/Cd) transporter
MTVREGHAIADDVRDCIIGDIADVVDVVVHVDPPESTLNAPTANEIGD